MKKEQKFRKADSDGEGISEADWKVMSWISLSGATITDNGTERTVTDPAASGQRKFYNVEISKP